MSADLRTALTKLAEKWDASVLGTAYARELRALLAAHPAPETAGHVCTPHCDGERGHYPAPVSDTRREDDELVEAVARALSRSEHPGVQAYIDARAVLAVLPAPPVVDETRRA